MIVLKRLSGKQTIHYFVEIVFLELNYVLLAVWKKFVLSSSYSIKINLASEKEHKQTLKVTAET